MMSVRTAGTKCYQTCDECGADTGRCSEDELSLNDTVYCDGCWDDLDPQEIFDEALALGKKSAEASVSLKISGLLAQRNAAWRALLWDTSSRVLESLGLETSDGYSSEDAPGLRDLLGDLATSPSRQRPATTRRSIDDPR